jgi:hypothetical protein
LKRPNTPAGVDETAIDRSSFITSVGLGGLFAGGIAVGFGLSNSGEKPMSVPEVCIEVETFISVFVMSIFLNNFPFFQTGQDWHGFSRVS